MDGAEDLTYQLLAIVGGMLEDASVFAIDARSGPLTERLAHVRAEIKASAVLTEAAAVLIARGSANPATGQIAPC